MPVNRVWQPLNGGILRCYLQQRGDADCRTSSDRDKSLIPHWFERRFVLLAQIDVFLLLRSSSLIDVVFSCTLRGAVIRCLAISLKALKMQSSPTFGAHLVFVWSGDCLSKSVSDPEGKGTPGEAGYDSHHGTSDIRNLSTDRLCTWTEATGEATGPSDCPKGNGITCGSNDGCRLPSSG
jgi:hypothetical protein